MSQEQDWKAYVEEQADNYGVPAEKAMMIFDLLGSSEAYNEFVIELELYAMQYRQELDLEDYAMIWRGNSDESDN